MKSPTYRGFDYLKWVGFVFALAAFGITAIFYFKRVFVDDVLLSSLTIAQYLATLVAVVFSLLYLRYWQSKIALAIILIVIFAMVSIEVGVH